MSKRTVITERFEGGELVERVTEEFDDVSVGDGPWDHGWHSPWGPYVVGPYVPPGGWQCAPVPATGVGTGTGAGSVIPTVISN